MTGEQEDDPGFDGWITMGDKTGKGLNGDDNR